MTDLSPLRVFRLLTLLGCSAWLPLAAVRGAEETATPAPVAPPAAAAPTAPSTAEPPPPPAAVSEPISPPAPASPSAVEPPAAPQAPAEPIEKPTATDATKEPTIEWQDRSEIVQFGSDVKLRANERVRSMVVMGGDVTVDGQVTGDLVAFGGDVEINGRVRGEIIVFGGDLELGPKAQLGRQLVMIGGEVHNPHERALPRQGFPRININFSENPAARWVRQGLSMGRLLVPGIGWPWMVFGAFALLYLVIAALFPRGVAACVESIEERPAGTVLSSFLMLFLLPLATLLLVATVIGGILVPFLMIGLVFAGIFGKASLATFLGRSLLRAFGLAEPASRIVACLAVGIVLFAVLYMIPVAGVLTWVVTAWYGLGVALFTVVKRMRREKAVTPKPAPSATAASTRRPMASSDFGSRSAGFSGDTTPAPAATAETSAPAMAAEVGAAPERSAPAVGAMAAEVSPEAAPTLPPSMEAPSVAVGAGAASAGFVGSGANAGASAVPPVLPPPPPAGAGAVPPVLPRSAASHLAGVNSMSPRAEFWPRLGAIVIDVVLIGIVSGITGLGEGFPFLFGAYSFALWLWRGTTIGGVVFGLKMVRLDDRPIDPATVLVRVLVGYISLAFAGLGFLWCAWDPEQQTWHDKVAGTIVVRAPKGMSLV